MARETTEEAVSRIANDAVYASRGNVTYSTPNGIANAIRQGMALAYRDAAWEANSDERVPRQLVRVLERRAEEIENG